LAETFLYTLVCYINIDVFLTAISTGIGLLSSKIHNGDDTPKESSIHYNPSVLYCNEGIFLSLQTPLIHRYPLFTS